MVEINMGDIIRAGKRICNTDGLKWKKKVEIPFNVMLSALFTTTGRGDRFAERCFNEIRQRAKNLRNIPMYLESLSDIKLEELAEYIKFNRKRFLDGVRGITILDKNTIFKKILYAISLISQPQRNFTTPLGRLVDLVVKKSVLGLDANS